MASLIRKGPPSRLFQPGVPDIILSQGWSTHAELIVPDDEYTFLLIPEYFHRFFIYDTCVYMYNVSLFPLLQLNLAYKLV
jgi:hypothetical protein